MVTSSYADIVVVFSRILGSTTTMTGPAVWLATATVLAGPFSTVGRGARWLGFWREKRVSPTSRAKKLGERKECANRLV